MYEYEHILETTASPEAIYQLLQDVPTWPTWDKGIERVELFGPFAAGTKGKIKLFDQEPLDFSITSVEPNRGFADETPIPGADISVVFNHILTPLEKGGTRITWQVKIVGPAAEEVGPQMGPMITADTPEAVANLAQLAQKMQANQS
jgi:hypothetical protein